MNITKLLIFLGGDNLFLNEGLSLSTNKAGPLSSNVYLTLHLSQARQILPQAATLSKAI